MAKRIAPFPVGTDAAVETVLGFVNTRQDTVGRVEKFGNADDFAAWAREHGLMGDETVSESEASAARELRSALLTVMLAHSENPVVTPEKVQQAERHLEHAGDLYPVKVTLSTQGASLSKQGRGAAGVFGEVLAAANEIAQHNRWTRMKACCSEPCEHGFVDRTKNGSQRFCEAKCASRAAMRVMRERKRSEDR